VAPVPIRVLVVDDHAAVRAALVELVGATGDMVVVGVAVDGQDALALAAERRPHVVLMDVSMPTMSGLEATSVLARERPCVHVLILSADARSSVVRAAREAGALGFLVKTSRGRDLLDAIRAVHDGRPTWPDGA
jgi:DNA-binding NarL/FixJ family response regulator